MDNIIKDVTKEKIEDILEKEKKNDIKCPCCKNSINETKKDCAFCLLTKHGHLSFNRDYYYCRYCGTSITLLDNKLKLFGDHKVTLRMAETIAYTGQLGFSFEDGANVIERFTGIKIGSNLVRSITEEAGELVFIKDMEEANKVYERPEEAIPSVLEKDKIDAKLYIMADGLHINTIHKDEKGKTWKEMKLGLVYVEYSNSNKKYDIFDKEYVAYFGEVGDFKKLLFDLAIRHGYGMIKEVIVIGDGAPWIWKMCEELFPDAKLILDYYHLKENVSKFSNHLYPKNEVEAKRWCNVTIDNIYEGNVEEVIQSIPIYSSKDLPAGIPNLRVYLENNKNRVFYKSYEKQGYSIGSGAVEGGNKSVIQKRMKGSGMRWSKSGGQQVASLRAKYSSNRWDDVLSVVGL